MKIPSWLKPAANGALLGALFTVVLGFSWGGWVTGNSARQMAADRAQNAVVTALTLVCLEQSRRDPQSATRVAELKTTASYSRADYVMKTGWATMPGTVEPDRDVASSCGNKLAS